MNTRIYTAYIARRTGAPANCGRSHPQSVCRCVACAEARGPAVWSLDPSRGQPQGVHFYCFVLVEDATETSSKMDEL